ncbi:MAG TPA: NrsF family protein [Steroidobacteraceae bacterium]|nr:NrsF family protein [Steroidobacteraceae bacterium]
MNTEALIRAMTLDAATAVTPLPLVMRRALALAVLGALAPFALLLQPRPDLAQVWLGVGFVVKVVVMVCLAITAWKSVQRVSTPLPPRAPLRLLWLPPALLLAGVLLELLTQPPASWTAGVLGRNVTHCLAYIPLLSLAPAVVLLLALRRAAPARPGLAGVVTGLAAGGLGASLYALACPEDSPLFVAAWYSLAIALVTGVCYAAGRRWLRW